MVILYLAGLAFCILGWNFKRGKLLNIIAGNTFTKPEDFDTPPQRSLGLIMSRLMYVGSAASLVNALGETALLFGLDEVIAIGKIVGDIAWVIFALMAVWTFWKSLHLPRQ